MAEETDNPSLQSQFGGGTAQAMLSDIQIDDTAPEPSGATKFFWKMFIFLLSIGLILWLQIGFVFVLLSLLPMMGAFLMDYRSRQKNLFKCIACCNIAGLLPYFFAASQHGAGAAATELMMMNWKTWLVIYGAAAGGWVIVWVSRLIAYGMLSVKYQVKITSLEREQQALLDEWGPQLKR